MNKLERDYSNSTSPEHQMNKNSWSNWFLIHSIISWGVFTCEIQIRICFASDVVGSSDSCWDVLDAIHRRGSRGRCWYSGSSREARGVVLLLNSHKAQCHPLN